MALAGMVLGALAARSSADAAIGALVPRRYPGDALDAVVLARCRARGRPGRPRHPARGEVRRPRGAAVLRAPAAVQPLQRGRRAGLRAYPPGHRRADDGPAVAHPGPAGVRPSRHGSSSACMRARALAVGSDAVDSLASAQRDSSSRSRRRRARRIPRPGSAWPTWPMPSRDWSRIGRALDKAEQALGAPHVFFARLRIANSLGAGDIAARPDSVRAGDHAPIPTTWRSSGCARRC